MRFYISGPITGHEIEAEEHFAWAEACLNAAGYYTINPERCLRGLDLEHDAYLPINREMLKRCDAILMLPGWRESVGACMELGMALAMGKRVFYFWAEGAYEEVKW